MKTALMTSVSLDADQRPIVFLIAKELLGRGTCIAKLYYVLYLCKLRGTC